MKKITVIYGAGIYGRKVYRIVTDINVNVECFVQTNRKQLDNIDSIPVISVDELSKYKENSINILYAIKDKTVFNEVDKRLRELNIEYQLYDCMNFIEDNYYSMRDELNMGDKVCSICENKINAFLSDGIKSNIFEKHHIIGGGYRENCRCPICGSDDRQRWILHVFKNKLSNFNGRVLHFAPERAISHYLNKLPNIDYYTADIKPNRAMHVIDITNIQFADETFDYIICNHVLEHIVDIEKAIFEVKRVLKGNGKFIFSFPICTDMKTIEDKTIVSPEERLEIYGQEDHVRLYGTDFAEIYEHYGFDLDIYRPMDELDKQTIEKLGFIEDDVIIVANKK